MTTFQTKENVMKNQEQANQNNNLHDPTVANDPQSQVEFEDLPISGEQEEQVKGGFGPAVPQMFESCAKNDKFDALVLTLYRPANS
jgi:hypothetical protein